MTAHPNLPPMFGFCPRCGWAGYAPEPLGSIFITWDGGSPTNEGITFGCPNCHRGNVVRVTRRDRVGVDLATALRDAGLSPAQLQALHAALAEATPDVTPRELTERFPDAAPVIVYTVNHYGSGAWLQVLGWLVAALVAFGVGYWAHTDAEKAATIPPAAAEHQPLHLSDEDVAKISAEVDAKLADRRKQQADEAQRRRDQGKTAGGR